MVIEGAECILLKDAAERSGYNAEHLRYLARKGHVRTHKLGRDWWYETSALDEYRAVNPFRKPRRGNKNE